MRKALAAFLWIQAVPNSATAAVAEGPPVHAWMALPFIVLLLAIALIPFINLRWWERHYTKISLGLGFFVVSYYSFVADCRRMLEMALDYFSFIVLIGALFVAAGGILLHTERRATPSLNILILAIGAVLANLLGTTGASMLLIRPFIRINRPRFSSFHLAFFIFTVSNIGGALTPVGDPPLLLGFLKGVPFHWTIINVWPLWLTALAMVLGIFFVLDTRSYRAWSAQNVHPALPGTIHFHGRRNLVFLLIILAAVFAQTPSREIIMIGAAAASHLFANKNALRENEFTFGPIREVAVLFAGIFATMVPALDWLNVNAARLGLKTPGQFFWLSGALSSVLDNAPTYLNFLSAALGLHGLSLDKPGHVGMLIAQDSRVLLAISAGSVFFGAMTYVGNGPNFMVRSIAEHHGIKCPSFFGYLVKYSLPVLLPVFLVIWALFFM